MNFTPGRFEQRLRASALRLKEQRNKERFYKNEPMHSPSKSEHTSCDQGIFDKQESPQHPARVMDDATYVNNILEKTRTLLNKHKETN
ncbi:Type III secretion protein [Pseudomonas putida]